MWLPALLRTFSIPSSWVRNSWGSNLTRMDFATVTAEGHPRALRLPSPSRGSSPSSTKALAPARQEQELHSLPSLCLLDSSFMPNKGPGAWEELTKEHSFSAVLRQIPHLLVQDGTMG